MKIIRSKRRTLGLEIRNGELLVRAPLRATNTDIEQFVAKNQNWIDKHLAKVRAEKANAAAAGHLSMAEIEKLADAALKVIPERVRFYAAKLGVRYGKITIRNQRTKWGSCSAKGNLNFNCLLMLAPPEVLDAIVVHELCHLKHMNHSADFYDEVLRIYPEYHRWNQWLKEHGGELMARMTG